ncbi:MAG: lysophospholipase [Sphaerochaetaceae bacterium]
MDDIRTLTCGDGHMLYYRVWLPAQGKDVKAVLHILHGMAEHSERYGRFASFLTEHGIAVYCQDHRGHGLTATKNNEKLGFLAKEHGWQTIADDSYALDEVIASDFPKVSHFMLGHSMGSFLARTVMVQHPDYFSGVIVMGTGASKGIVGWMGRRIALSHVRKYGADHTDAKLDKMSFSSYLKRIPEHKTSFDWLSRDEVEVKKYVDDPLCGFVCTSSFFVDLLDGIAFANDPKRIASIPKDLPILLISGDADPVGEYGKGVRASCELYKDAGISDVELRLVHGARHEVLNETNREQTEAFLLSWMEKRI